MNPEDIIPEPRESEHNAESRKQPSGHPLPPQEESITRIADLQRMNVDQLNQFAKNVGLRNLGALTKSQIVFDQKNSIHFRFVHGKVLLNFTPRCEL